REDLFYRLEVLPIRVPSLAERREDISELLAFFTRTACERHHLPQLEVSEGAFRAAQSTEWPGNVRQLAHAAEAAAIRAAGEGAARMERIHLFPDTGEPPGEKEAHQTFQEATRGFQSQLLQNALEECDWNVSEVAHGL